jgi:hypothetical protein
MSVFKSQFSRALPVIKSDNANVPYPTSIATGTNTSTSASKLVNSAATFITNNVATGDIVYNTTDSTAATVVSVNSETQLTLNADIFTATSKSYVVYQASAQTGLGNTGCYLYIGGAGTLNIVTIGGDSLLISGLTAGTVLPIQVLQVKSGGTATLITALW